MQLAIEVRNLVKRYRVWTGGLLRRRYEVIEALRGLSFRVDYGEVYGLLGPNGAGKTTAVKIISTLLLPDSGDAFVCGYSSIREPYKVRECLGVMLSVERGFFWKLTGIENLRYFGTLYGIPRSELDNRIRRVAELTGLYEVRAHKRRFEDMSLGMKARLALARALLRDPRVLVLDEPTLGLDPPSARRIRSLVRELARKGRGILLTTHNMFEAEMVCDRVGIIVKGRIIAEGTPDELKARVKGKSSVVVLVRGPRERVEAIAEAARRELGIPASLTDDASEGHHRLRLVCDPESTGRVSAWVAEKALTLGVRVVGWRIEEPTLEDVFVEVAGRA
jgi:ABC-2 type transport system ATP-binding protein